MRAYYVCLRVSLFPLRAILWTINHRWWCPCHRVLALYTKVARMTYLLERRWCDQLFMYRFVWGKVSSIPYDRGSHMGSYRRWCHEKEGGRPSQSPWWTRYSCEGQSDDHRTSPISLPMRPDDRTVLCIMKPAQEGTTKHSKARPSTACAWLLLPAFLCDRQLWWAGISRRGQILEVVSSLVMRTEMVLEVSVYLPFNHLTWLLVWEFYWI